ncbi:phosphatidate cytidylyltransferase [Mycoplasma suis KI3806]|uniref:Phosphatidate cytidylyltransferase n=1 Tax=Mycoplasma suis (strain KI_3806) TaxID=708248 RepID=F0V1K1_MYCS3|nr:membrane protein [Mycoplasma suis]CBZ40532.1 phosphatidate cytidylyltransferase [Mycoplasma suis KI3806]
MSSLWSSNQEKSQRVRHSINVVICCVVFTLLLSVANISSFAQGGSLSSYLTLLKGGPFPNSIEFVGKFWVILFTSYLVFNSAGEILSTIVHPSQFAKGKKYQIIFTLIAFGPLLFNYLNRYFLKNTPENTGEGFKIESATHYLFFQLYFWLGNIVAFKFFSKFFLSSLDQHAPDNISTRVVAKLLRWHYLGWSSFFLLAFFLPFWILIVTVLLVFSNSTWAFIIGRQCGKNCFSRFSLFKSVEGLNWAALITTTALALAVAAIRNSGVFGHGVFSCRESFFFVFLIWVAVMSYISHFGENTFGLSKRLLGYKNFGRLFGTKVGGFWDRFDGLSVALFFSAISMWAIHAGKLGSIGINIELLKQIAAK